MVNAPFEKSFRTLGETIQVNSIMSHPVFSLTTGDSVLTLMEAIEAKGIRHIPIFDAQDKLCAVATQSDILSFAPSLTSGLSPSEKAKVLARFTVWDLLYSKAESALLSLKPEDSIAEAARRMKETKQDCATVFGEKGELLGILTEADFISLFAGGAP